MKEGLQVGQRGSLTGLLAPRPGEALLMVPLTHIAAQAEFNPRGQVNPEAFSAASLRELGRSIRQHGLLQPLIVRPRPGAPGRYWLIAGERRYRAACLNAEDDRAAGRAVERSSVPVLVREVGDAEALELAIMENAQRQDLDLIEESLVGLAHLQRLTQLDAPGLRAYLVAARKQPELDRFQVDAVLRRLYGTGISVWSQQRIRVLDLDETEREAVRRGQVPFKVALEVSRAPLAQRAELLGRAADEQLSVAQVRALLPQRTAAPPELNVPALRRALPKLDQLSGAQAQRAGKLIAELLKLLK